MAYLRFSLDSLDDLDVVDEGLAEQEQRAVETIQCITEHATSGQCKDAAKRLVRLTDLRQRIRTTRNAYEEDMAQERAKAGEVPA